MRRRRWVIATSRTRTCERREGIVVVRLRVRVELKVLGAKVNDGLAVADKAASHVPTGGHDHAELVHAGGDREVLRGVVYDPAAPAGERWSDAGIPASPIPRMYHSTATLTPFGDIMLGAYTPLCPLGTES